MALVTRTLTIGTRGSELALIQAGIASTALKQLHPELSINICVIQTQGDVNHNPIPLDTIGKGWFTGEIEQALLRHDIDLAVHSLKDMADEMTTELHIGAYLEREDARDVLVTKNGESLEELKSGAVIGTDSARRQVQILELCPDLRVQSMRGNITTRLEKLARGEYDAAILAAAGLKRLGLTERIMRYFEPHEITPAPGQGVLALQSRTGDYELNALLTKLNNPDAAQAAMIERSFSRATGGGCKSPTGAYAARHGDECVLTVMIVSDDGTLVRKTSRAPWVACSHLGEASAQELLALKNRGTRA